MCALRFANAVCTPRSPGCAACPLGQNCAARRAGTPEAWPVKAPKKTKPARRGIAFVAIDNAGRAFMVTRPERGLLGGMLAFPSAGWTPDDGAYDPGDPFAGAPFEADWRMADDDVGHVFTHFSLTMDVAVAAVDDDAVGATIGWHPVRPASLPTLMRKVWKVAQRQIERSWTRRSRRVAGRQ